MSTAVFNRILFDKLHPVAYCGGIDLMAYDYRFSMRSFVYILAISLIYVAEVHTCRSDDMETVLKALCVLSSVLQVSIIPPRTAEEFVTNAKSNRYPHNRAPTSCTCSCAIIGRFAGRACSSSISTRNATAVRPLGASPSGGCSCSRNSRPHS